MKEAPVTIPIPRWYQDLSIPQMQNVFSLGDNMRADYAERVTGRTQRALGDIGVTSTFVNITSEQIKKLRRLTDLDPVKFLCEIYRIVTGKYFTDEEYKKTYDCNERIILSAIAFLTLPETVVELHRRIPMGEAPKFPPKPMPNKVARRTKGQSPYLEPLFIRPDWLTYKKELYLWRKHREETPVPRAILPPSSENPGINEITEITVESEKVDKRDKEKLDTYQPEKTDKGKDYGHENKKIDKTREKVDKLPINEGESAEQHRRNSISQPEKKIDDKIRETNKLSKGEVESTKQHRPNIIAQREKKIHNKTEEETNKLSKGEVKSTKQHRPDIIAQRDKKIHNKTEEEKNKLSKGEVESTNQHSPNIISQRDKKIHNKTEEETNKLSGAQKNTEKPLKSNFLSQKSSKTRHSVVEKNKLFEREGQSEQSPKLNVLPQKQNPLRSKIEHENSEKNNRSNYSKQSTYEKKFYLDNKETHLIISGVTKNDELANNPISHETHGVACVTPCNSDESFFQALNIVDTKKSYPRGRENLSRYWQEWFREVDEEFIKVEDEANKILKSVETTLKLMGPEIICDSCCSCRQTRKANVKYHKTKIPRAVIDSITMDGEQNRHVVGSLAFNSPAPSPSESMADLPEVVDSHEKIIKSKIISGVINEKGEMNYYISGVSKETEHVPRKIISNSALRKLIKNVPPCGCAIEKMINEGLTEITSDDNIPWTKKNEICIGKKYRPRDTGASSCRDYPNDKTCRRNPFKKKVDEQIRAKLREKEKSDKDNYPPEKKNMYSMAAFQPCGDEDGMAICGGPWGAVNIPDEEELARREAEAKLIRESPPCGDKPGRAICGAPFGSRHPLPKKPKKDDDDDDEEPEDEEPEEKKKRSREPRQKAVETKIEKLLNRDNRCSTVANENERTGKQNETSVGLASKKEDNRKKRKSSKENGKEGRNQNDDETRRKDETKKLKNQWNRMKIMANKFFASSMIVPEVLARTCKRETTSNCCDDNETMNEESTMKEGPFAWKTPSEQALPVEKTLLYLVEPNEQVETIPVRPGGKPCKCRENRNAKKILLYNVSGITRDGEGKRDEKISRVIDGLIYITPVPSVRNSEEYIPEYELYESPYEKCTRERKDDNFKYIERYLGPKSLMKKQPRDSTGCKCSSTKKNIVDSSGQAFDDNNKQLITKELMMPEKKKWSRACRDEGLIEFYARCRDNVPCWLRCVEFSKNGCCTNPRRLQIKRPVCECKYERKILKRDEEKKKWLSRQERLKSHKKQPRIQVHGLSRPMITDTNLIISDVKRITGQDESEDDDLQYCVAGIAQERIMAEGECVLSGIGMYTPVTTPEPSKPELPIFKEHRHWSPIDVRGTKTFHGNTDGGQLRETIEKNWRDKINDKTDKKVDVLFQSDQVTEVRAKSLKLDGSVNRDKGKGIYHDGGKDKIRNSKGKDDISHRKGKDDILHSKGKDNTYRDEEKDVELEKLHSISPAQQPREHKPPGSSHAESVKKIPEKEFSQGNKSNVHTRKSTGSINSREKRPLSHDKKKEVSSKTDEEKDVELKKLHSISHAQQPREHKPPGSSHAESVKKFPEKEFSQGNKSNVHTRKSTGSINSREKRSLTHGKKKEVSSKIDLKHLLQIELDKMANEGFLFAKLPSCYQMPQLQYWIMYRTGIALSPEEKKNLMSRSMKIWKSVEKQKPKKIKAPALTVPKKVMKNLSWDKADDVKREVASKRALFYSNLRKTRVLQARAMWGLMEFGKFPGISFKSAFFTYLASKESDGFVFKPWENSDKTEES